MRLQSKRVALDGLRWLGTNHEELFQFFAQFADQKPVLEDNIAEVELTLEKAPRLWVKTNRGNIEVRQGDWILRTAEGEFVGMKHSVFEQLFQSADEPDPPPECDECHVVVPEHARAMEGTWHETHCSLHAYPDIDRE